jgi:hypothetical protein
MATLTNVTLKKLDTGGKVGAAICTATGGSADLKTKIMALQGVQWSDANPADYLQKKVKIEAKLDRMDGVGPKSFHKDVYVTRMSIAGKTVSVREQQAGG